MQWNRLFRSAGGGATCVLIACFAAAAQAQVLQPKMGKPLNGLTPAELARFDSGRTSFLHVLQVPEGLGPIMNQTSCANCHNQPVGGSGSIFVTRFGLFDPKGAGFDPLDAFGGSLLQAQSISIACAETVPPFATVTAHRITTSTLGLGLIEAIPDADILARETNPPAGVSGASHMVQPFEDPTGPLRVGRFGWKAQVATVLTFSGDAALNEMGLTNRLFGQENAPNGDTSVLATCDTVADPEDVADAQGVEFIDHVTSFQRLLAAPPQTPKSGMTGETLFNQIGCADCHTPSYTTANDPALETALRNKPIRPYSDFLLHDMGINADFIEQGGAGMQEMRTPPLWGLRRRDPMWHDGRCSGGTFADRIQGPNGVIVQHQGFLSESAASATAFFALSQADQTRVVDFLNSLGRAEFDGDGDNDVDYQDLTAFRIALGSSGVNADSANAVFDLDQDGDVDAADEAGFVQAFDVDANSNGVGDLLDIANGTSFDSNHNDIPDETEFCQQDVGFGGPGTMHFSVCGDQLDSPAAVATALLEGALPSTQVYVLISLTAAPTPYVGGGTIVPSFPFDYVDVSLFTDAQGRVVNAVPGSAQSLTLVVQAAVITPSFGVDFSNALVVRYGP
jgi:hypothetical protein